MCMHISESRTLRLREEMAATRSKSVLLYKLYRRTPSGLASPYHPNAKGGRIGGPGWIESDRRRARFNKCQMAIDKGCHVFRSLGEAQTTVGIVDFENGGVIVPVRGHLDDFVAANATEAAFTRVYLTKKNFQRAMRGKT